jgi:hypothetical protein
MTIKDAKFQIWHPTLAFHTVESPTPVRLQYGLVVYRWTANRTQLATIELCVMLPIFVRHLPQLCGNFPVTRHVSLTPTHG